MAKISRPSSLNYPITFPKNIFIKIFDLSTYTSRKILREYQELVFEVIKRTDSENILDKLYNDIFNIFSISKFYKVEYNQIYRINRNTLEHIHSPSFDIYNGFVITNKDHMFLMQYIYLLYSKLNISTPKTTNYEKCVIYFNEHLEQLYFKYVV